MIFLTSGSLKGFDRLVKSVDDLVERGVIQESVFAQIGPGRYEPRHMEFVRFLPQDEFRQHITEATLILSHVGVGTILLADEAGIPVIAVPRLSRLGEHVNDHQTDTARSMEKEGLCLIAWDEGELVERIEQSRDWRPRERENDLRLVEVLRRDILALGDPRTRSLRRRFRRQSRSS